MLLKLAGLRNVIFSLFCLISTKGRESNLDNFGGGSDGVWGARGVVEGGGGGALSLVCIRTFTELICSNLV